MTEVEEAIQILHATKDRLFEKGWYQGDYGYPSGPTCLAGAYQMVACGCFEVEAAITIFIADELSRVIQPLGYVYIASFNDDVTTTFDDVINVIDITIKSLESRLH